MAAVQNANSLSQLMTVMNGSSNTSASPTADVQDKFLKLLVTQMQNQDPLNPMDNAQVTSQLAQLSTVDGITKLNTTLQSLSASYAQSQSLQAASLVGRSVLAPGSSLELKSGVSVGGVELSQPADKVVVTIKDSAGNVQQSIDLGPQKAGVVGFGWDGVRDNGATAADGSYTFDVSALQAGSAVTANKLALGSVGSVSLGAQGITLNTTQLGAVDLSQIKQIF